MQILSPEVVNIIVIASIIFLIAPLFIIIYAFSYNRKKRSHYEEKLTIQHAFEKEMIKAGTEAQEKTLKSVAYGLHDNIGQLLSLTSLTLSSVGPTDKCTAKKIKSSAELVDIAIKELNRLAKFYQGEELPAAGLYESIRKEIDWLNTTGKYEIHLDLQETDTATGQMSNDLSIFRLFQESLNNVIKHAAATRIDISLSYYGNTVTLRMTDNGVGFSVEQALAKKSGMGLHNMLNRVKMLNGNISIDSSLDKGCSIAIKIPYN